MPLCSQSGRLHNGVAFHEGFRTNPVSTVGVMTMFI